MRNPPASIPAKRAQYVTYTWNYEEYKRHAPILLNNSSAFELTFISFIKVDKGSNVFTSTQLNL